MKSRLSKDEYVGRCASRFLGWVLAAAAASSLGCAESLRGLRLNEDDFELATTLGATADEHAIEREAMNREQIHARVSEARAVAAAVLACPADNLDSPWARLPIHVSGCGLETVCREAEAPAGAIACEDSPRAAFRRRTGAESPAVVAASQTAARLMDCSSDAIQIEGGDFPLAFNGCRRRVVCAAGSGAMGPLCTEEAASLARQQARAAAVAVLECPAPQLRTSSTPTGALVSGCGRVAACERMRLAAGDDRLECTETQSSAWRHTRARR